MINLVQVLTVLLQTVKILLLIWRSLRIHFYSRMQTCYEKKRPCPITSSRSANDPISHLSNGDATSLKSLIALRWKIGLTELPVVCSFSWTVLHCAWPSGCLEVNKEYQWSNDNWNSDLNSLFIPSTRHLFCWIYANQNASRQCQLLFSFLVYLSWCWCNCVQRWPWTSRTSKHELTPLVSKLCHLVGPWLEDNLHVASMSAEVLNSNQTSPQTGAEFVSELDVHTGGPPGRCLAPARSSCGVSGVC